MNQFKIEKLGITALNDMQIAASEAIEAHRDILLLSPTGSGKTLAFLLPILNQINLKGKQIQVMIS